MDGVSVCDHVWEQCWYEFVNGSPQLVGPFRCAKCRIVRAEAPRVEPPPRKVVVTLTGREIAILAAVLGRCEGWDDPRELERFLSTASDQVMPGGFSEEDMHALSEKLARAWYDRAAPVPAAGEE